MDFNKLVELVISDLTRDRLIIEQDLNQILNSDLKTTDKLCKLKELLRELSINQLSLNNFLSMTNKNEDNG